jgi:hypothetical protein
LVGISGEAAPQFLGAFCGAARCGVLWRVFSGVSGEWNFVRKTGPKGMVNVKFKIDAA